MNMSANNALSQSGPTYNALRIQTSTYGMVIPVVFGTMRITGNLIWAGDFIATPNSGGIGGGKGGLFGGRGAGSTSYTYSSAVAIGLCEGPIISIGQVWADKSTYASLPAFLSLFLGSYGQAAWSYLTAHHAGQDLKYPGFAYVASPSLSMGTSDALPNMSFEVKGFNIVAGLHDANPADIITGILTDTKYGLGLSGSLIDVTDYTNYCLAANLLLSPAFNQAKAANQHIQDLLDHTNATMILHDGATLTVVPFGDTSMTANGTTWNPNVTPVYDLTDDDYIADSSADPIKVTRTSPADAYNDIKVEFLDRANNYNISTAEAKDQAAIDTYYLRPDQPKTMHYIADASIARTIAQLLLQRELYVRNEFDFRLGMDYCLLEPMDLVTLTDSALGLSKYPVRIVKIEENENWEFDITAEDFPAGTGHAATYGSQSGSGYAINYNVDPGDVNVPVIFVAPGILTQSGYEIWLAVSGGANWGGCDVWVSSDNTTFAFAGRLYGPSRHGSTTATLASHADPDATNTLSVDLSSSGGTLLSGTQADADADITLCLVGTELIAYETATLTSANHYDLTYLRRGQYNSPIASHAAATRFVRLDNQLLKVPYNSNLNGTELYFKFLSFNTWQGAQQGLGDVSPYTYVIGAGLSYPPNVTGFVASQNGSFVVFSWAESNSPDVAGYEIRYNPQGDYTWSDGVPITQVEKGTHLVSMKVAPGNWSFLICAINTSGNYSATPAVTDLTTLSTNVVVAGGVDQAGLGWPGTLTNFIVHPSGVLCPQSQGYASSDLWDTFDKFCPNPYATSTYIAPEITTPIDTNVRVFGEIGSALGPGETGNANPQLWVKWHKGVEAYNAYQPWSIGDVTADAVTMEFIMTTSIGLAYISSFTPTLDAVTRSEQGINVAVSVAGQAITFTNPFVNIPVVQVTAVGTPAVTPMVSGPSTTGFTIMVYDSGGIATSGTVNWMAQGT